MTDDKTHFINGSIDDRWSACGLGRRNMTAEPGEVTCLQCRRTVAWRAAAAAEAGSQRG